MRVHEPHGRSFAGGKLTILQEGTLIKLVNKLQQVSYNAAIARKKGQKMHYVTERAVFELTPEGLLMTSTVGGGGRCMLGLTAAE